MSLLPGVLFPAAFVVCVCVFVCVRVLRFFLLRAAYNYSVLLCVFVRLLATELYRYFDLAAVKPN